MGYLFWIWVSIFIFLYYVFLVGNCMMFIFIGLKKTNKEMSLQK